MRISIITPTFNSEETIKKNILSIQSQNFHDYEQIIMDKKSTDKTLEIIKEFGNDKIKILSEADNGIYDAINKGINLARGKYILILNSDDYFYTNDVLHKICQSFSLNNVDILYGNLIYVDKKYKPLRLWISNTYEKGFFHNGWSPPHPSFVVKKKIYEKYGLYKQSIGNPADIELMYRFLEKKNINFVYLDKILVSMRIGGISNRSIYKIFIQNIKILQFLNIHLNIFKILRFFFLKCRNRVKQFYDGKKINFKGSIF